MISHPVPPKVLTQIGDIFVSFALVEMNTESLAGGQLGNKSKLVTVELSFRRLCQLTVNLWRETPQFAEVKALMKRAAQLEDRRNLIAHSIWGAGDNGTITRIKTTAKEKGLKFTHETMSESDLAKIAADMRDLAEDIQNFQLNLALAQHGWDEKPKRKR